MCVCECVFCKNIFCLDSLLTSSLSLSLSPSFSLEQSQAFFAEASWDHDSDAPFVPVIDQQWLADDNDNDNDNSDDANMSFSPTSNEDEDDAAAAAVQSSAMSGFERSSSRGSTVSTIDPAFDAFKFRRFWEGGLELE